MLICDVGPVTFAHDHDFKFTTLRRGSVPVPYRFAAEYWIMIMMMMSFYVTVPPGHASSDPELEIQHTGKKPHS
eukprot:954493-Rhodomonas_salina.2